MAVLTDERTPTQLKSYQAIEEMVDSNQEKYLLINLLARRAREINEGTRALVELPVPYTPIDLAIAEARAGKLLIVRHDDTPAAEEDAETAEAEA
jgi:DNA-directed RNA polymerase subunit K/omega